MEKAPAKLTQDLMDTRAEIRELLKALPFCPESQPVISDQDSGFLKHSFHTSRGRSAAGPVAICGSLDPRGRQGQFMLYVGDPTICLELSSVASQLGHRGIPGTWAVPEMLL